ncbi:MAG: NTP transferase domain-containing protein [Patescibacteria group bacterium]|jgi:bifunctional N-acetylglucosamine-1-phosphate-uridyltransferase/glucosamine-1-phosphate-acetyltransferase GlmU-like protein
MTRIVILAAGKGTRMDSELPKVLVPLNGRPMIKYLLDSVVASAVDPKPIIVVSPDNKDVISQSLSEYDLEYVVQDKILGTGHAVACTRDALADDVDHIIVLYGDHPFLKAESIKRFAAHQPIALTVMPTLLPNFDDWYQNFYHWGRMVRGADGRMEKIVELKDASEEEKLITEVNPGFMAFNRKWLFSNIIKLNNDNKAKEYYLTSLVNIAFEENYSVETISIEPTEAMGINSLEELRIAENLVGLHSS